MTKKNSLWGEHGGVDGVGDGVGDVAPVCAVRLMWFTINGCGSGCVSSHIGKLGDGGVAAVVRLDNSISWSVANSASVASVSAVSGVPVSMQCVTNVTILDIGTSWLVGWCCLI